MARKPKFSITFAPEVLEHLDSSEPKYHRLLRQAIAEQLSYTPGEETRNRKPLAQPALFAATWELRCGPQNRFWVFYDIDLDARTVFVLAIGVEERERLLIGGEEYPL